jgi:hypothetical protein
MAPSKLTLQEFTTTLSADEVLARAKGFFSERSALYAAFLDKEGPTHCTFRGQGGEEIVIATTAGAGGTRVTGSTYLFDMQVARFFATLPAVPGTGDITRKASDMQGAGSTSAVPA